MDTAEFHMGTHTGLYIQEIKKNSTETIQLKVVCSGGACDVRYFFLFRCIYFL